MAAAGRTAALAALSAALLGAAPSREPPAEPPPSRYRWRLPPGFPEPRVPADNPMTAAKVELGRHLFFDPRLSGDGNLSCAGCHRPELAFTDGRSRAVGATGERHPRSAMSLANVAYAASLTWADPGRRRLEDQALVPLRSEHPVEMGLAGREAEVLARLRAAPRYRALFAAAFPGAPAAADLEQVTRAIAAFERTLLSGRSAYDRLVHDGDMTALSEAAWRGMTLFFSDRLKCARCHEGFTLSGPVVHAAVPNAEPTFHDTGVHPPAAYRAGDTGLHAVTGRDADRGRFRAPTLRNVAVTAPYMHDGSLATLDDVLDHYAGGGRGAAADPGTSALVAGFTLTDRERADVIAFLRSLTDESFLDDPRLQDPWPVSRRIAGRAPTP